MFGLRVGYYVLLSLGSENEVEGGVPSCLVVVREGSKCTGWFFESCVLYYQLVR